MQSLQNTTYEKKDGIAYITIDRPKALNALNHATIGELRSAIEDARDDAAVRGVIVTGAGGKAFVAGADIAEIAEISFMQAQAFTRSGQETFDMIEQLGKPVVAAVKGFALGGGCELAMACTLRLATPNAAFGQPEVKLGIIPGFGGTQRLPRRVGKGRAMQLILTADAIDAAEAHRIGLVNEIVDADQLISRAEALVHRIAANGPIATRLAIDAVNFGLEATQTQGLALESWLFSACVTTDDKREGTLAFLEKRRPHFSGR
jgi:enoyl-CoA hydratase